MMAMILMLSFILLADFFCLESYLLKVYIHNVYFFISFIFLFFFMFLNKWWSLISHVFGLNFYSFSLVLLSFWIFGLMLMSLNSFSFFFNKCIFLINCLLLILLLSFMCMNLLLFYFFFEVSLIPTILLIIFWGMSIDRLSASFYLLFYTLMFSLPLLIVILYLSKNVGSALFFILEFFNVISSFFIYLLIISPFLVKLPMFMLHNWLLKAHVESPVYGSMFLAGLMLKLGSYGFLRILLMMKESTLKFGYFFMSVNLFGSIFISLLCLCQIDMKIIVAYSSVVHMGMLMSGILTLFKIGILGAYMMMVAHGLCSSGMFFLVNVCYERTGSRLVLFNKGMLNMMPSMSLFWFLLCSSNMSAPLSLNLVSEIFLISSILIWMKYLFIFLAFICFFSFLYSLYLFSYVQHGSFFSKKMFFFNSGKLHEFLVLIFHWLPLNLFILNLSYFMV